MSKAGFFFWPKLVPGAKGSEDDTSVCFQCGLALDGWEEADDPREEHSKRRPECPFIKNGISIRPCSFEFILSMKPDLNAVTHISARPAGSVIPNSKFKIPTVPNPPAKKPRQSKIPPNPYVKAFEDKKFNPKAISAKMEPPPATPKKETLPQIAVSGASLIVGLEAVVADEQKLDLTVEDFLGTLVLRRLEKFDLHTQKLLETFDNSIGSL